MDVNFGYDMIRIQRSKTFLLIRVQDVVYDLYDSVVIRKAVFPVDDLL